MFGSLDCAVILLASTMFAATAFAQSARDVRGPSPLVAIEKPAAHATLAQRP
jgi:hypothetical protein